MLVFVDGMSTTGKTTVIKNINEKMGKNICIAHFENDDNHLLRLHLDKIKNVNESHCYIEYFNELIDVWRKKLGELNEGEMIHIFDGYIFHELERTFLINKIPWGLVCQYYERLNEILSEFDCYIFVLYRANIGTSVYDTFKLRSDKWVKYKLWQLSLISGETVADKEDIEVVTSELQRKMIHLYDRITVPKELIDTSEEDWNPVVNRILGRIKNGIHS